MQIDEIDNMTMSFDNLVKLAEIAINKKIQNPSEIEVNCSDSSLELYKQTINEIIASVISDSKLLELLKEKETLSDTVD